MRGGERALLATVALATAGCATDDGKLNVRAIADPLAAAAKRGSPMVAEGRGALALGNVGTALEAFRKALREQPDSIEALAGIAACYERMGRYDLSRVNYEAALAIAPNNPVLLNTFAASLQLQGRLAEANALRAEAAQAEAHDVAAAVQTAQAEIAPAPAPAVAAPPPVEIAAAAPVIEAAPARPAPVTKSAPVIAQVDAPVVHTELAGTTQWTVEASKPAPSIGSITVALPPARPADDSSPPQAPEPTPQDRDPAKAVAAVVERASRGAQPRLQRLSMGEVALLTGSGPAWRTQVVAQTQRSLTARFVPLKAATAASRPNIRLLNAARRQGLAAQTRGTLLDRGWRKIAIGDAAQVRARSIVLYPAGRQVLGKRLAAQFGFASAINRSGNEVLVLLGRDAAELSFYRARG